MKNEEWVPIPCVSNRHSQFATHYSLFPILVITHILLAQLDSAD